MSSVYEWLVIAVAMGLAVWVLLRSYQADAAPPTGERAAAGRGDVFLAEPVLVSDQCACMRGLPVRSMVSCGEGRGGALCLMCLREEVQRWILWRVDMEPDDGSSPSVGGMKRSGTSPNSATAGS